jgi:hypothetical protein
MMPATQRHRLRNLLLTVVAWTLVAAGGASSAQAREVRSMEMVLQLVVPSGSDWEDMADDWPDACDAVSTALATGKGPWGLSPFAGVTCLAPRAPAPRAKADVLVWHVRIAPSLKKTLIAGEALVSEGGSSCRPAFPPVSLPPMQSTIKSFKDEEAARLLAATILERMPAMGRVSATKTVAKKRVVASAKADDDEDLPLPPKALALYRLYLDEATCVWSGDQLGRASLRNLKGGRRGWVVDEDVPGAVGAVLFAHDELGPQVRGKEFDAKLSKLLRDADNVGEVAIEEVGEGEEAPTLRRFDTFAFTLRHGRSPQSQDAVLTAPLTSLALELYRPVWSRFSLGFDYYPKKESANGSFLAWHRESLGWNFLFREIPFISQLVLTPRIGIWTVDARLLAEEADESESLDFSLSRALSFGGQAAVDLNFKWLRLRLFHGRDITMSAFSRFQKQGKITTARSGIEVLWAASLLPAGYPHFSPLVFALVEEATLSRETDDAAQDQAVLSQVSLVQPSFGLGFRLGL